MFHAFPDLLSGGFVGVDVFFVISGYLITGNILSGIDNKKFSILSFYSRRIRRIFPSLIIVLLTSVSLGWFIMLPDEFERFGVQITAAAAFFSNFQLLAERGYFDHAVETKPLIHLWPLGVEEQFYLIWPVLVLVFRKARVHLIVMIVLVLALSFGLNIIQSSQDAQAAFYLPQTRFWELMSGALLVAVPPRFYERGWQSARSTRNVFALAGTFLVLAGFLLTPSDGFPSWWPLPTIAGAALILLAGPEAWLNRHVLSSPGLVWLGLLSYPLYLWHWPLLSFARILAGETPSIEVRMEIVLVSLALAWLTTRLVEAPLRFGRLGGLKTASLFATMLAVGVFGQGIVQGGGLPDRAVAHLNDTVDSGWSGGDGGASVRGCGVENMEEAEALADCVHDGRGEPRIALLGDSKAAAIYQGLVRTSSERGRWLFIGGSKRFGGLVTVLSDSPVYPPEYSMLTRIAIKTVAKNKVVDTVVIVVAARALFQIHCDHSMASLPENPNFDAAFQGLDAAVQALVQAGKRVTLVVDNPTLPHPEDCMGRRSSSEWLNQLLIPPGGNTALCYPTVETHRRLTKQYRDLLEQVRQAGNGMVTIFDTTPYMCDLDQGACPPRKDGHQLYAYTDHMSDYAAGLIGKDLNAVLDREHFQIEAP